MGYTMVLFQLPHRQIKVAGDLSELVAPYVVYLNMSLGPQEFFGEANLSGILRIMPEGSIKAEGTLFEGMSRMRSSEQAKLATFDHTSVAHEIVLQIKGSNATVTLRPGSLEILSNVIQRLIEFLPSAFSAVTTCAVAIKSFTGHINHLPFTIQPLERVPGGESFVVGEITKDVTDYLDLIVPLMLNLPRKIVSAHRYLAQSFLLEQRSEYSYQFTGERLLNLCKAFEALMPSSVIGSVDAIRKYLPTMGVNPEFVEIFASLKYVRSQLDSAHIATSPLSDEAHRIASAFVPIAERAMQALIVTSVKLYSRDKTLFQDKPVDEKDPTVLKAVQKYKNLIIPKDWA